MVKLNTRTMEDILSEYTTYVMLLKEASLHQFKHKLIHNEYEICMHKDAEGNGFSLRLKEPPVDKDITNELILLERNYDSLKEAFGEMLNKSEFEDDKLGWSAPNGFLITYSWMVIF